MPRLPAGRQAGREADPVIISYLHFPEAPAVLGELHSISLEIPLFHPQVTSLFRSLFLRLLEDLHPQNQEKEFMGKGAKF